jgi:hypothetical protein
MSSSARRETSELGVAMPELSARRMLPLALRKSTSMFGVRLGPRPADDQLVTTLKMNDLMDYCYPLS